MCSCEDRPCCGCDSETYSIYEGDYYPIALRGAPPRIDLNYDTLQNFPINVVG
jgi:hypothetical protein